ncbi:FkbM family methyltransferase [Thiovibrio frasassiensis]|uniref:FkbM family methyltransferase n=1 Tax=Thiovibrio frasassiensis TaxID=2984131 RepID=A0A9X4RLT2_9BACT|nr:FkbM family methyltransferase [Thiovibrio frasassiensis]MDG4476034.1 FkbM family methyltransferase [Thiovibrio frasassiensis]
MANKIVYLYKLYVLRDSFLVSVKKWFKDFGYNTFQLDYPLDSKSVVLDVGGYVGDYAGAIHQKYGCRVYVFEPVPAFYRECVDRFSNNPSIICLNYGLSSNSGWFEMGLDNNASSFKRIEAGDETQLAQVRSVTEVFADLGLGKIDLIKMNIEGGEFDLLPAMIDSGLIKQVRYIQIQFHNFFEGAVEDRLCIRKLLEKTHRQMWNYEFVWESWELL